MRHSWKICEQCIHMKTQKSAMQEFKRNSKLAPKVFRKCDRKNERASEEKKNGERARKRIHYSKFNIGIHHTIDACFLRTLFNEKCCLITRKSCTQTCTKSNSYFVLCILLMNLLLLFGCAAFVSCNIV